MKSSKVRVRIALFSTLFPSSARPTHGIFVETRLRQLLSSGGVDARVVAPVPWFPWTSSRFGLWGRIASTPVVENRHGIDVWYPRYALPPMVGQNIAPLSLALGAYPTLRRFVREGFDFDLIDAHYYYPDGVAAALLGKWLDKPVVITARGSDLNVLGTSWPARRMMRWAGRRAAGSVGVSSALVSILRGWGVDRTRLHVIRNGVDLQRFRPLDRFAARTATGTSGTPVLLCVGNLVEVKGHDLVIEATARLTQTLPNMELIVIGDGPLRDRLQAQAEALGIACRVRFVGTVPNDQLAPWYSAADALVLASRSEGWANVLLEAMACGTPVVATDVGGSAEAIGDSDAGRLVLSRDVGTLADTIARAVSSLTDRGAVRLHAEGYGWEATTLAQLELFRSVVSASARHGRKGADIGAVPSE
jgi:glycosyltransferase involved in cell wall biosynthesis